MQGGTRGLGTASGALAASMVMALVTGAPAAGAPPTCLGQAATVVGTGGDDTLKGTARRDVIVARGGNDTITARGGDDLICAGGGEIDFIFAGGGDDRVKGSRGFDVTFPAGGDDDVDGGAGFDYVTYEGTPTGVEVDLGAGTAQGQGNDHLTGIEGVAGSEGDDVLIGTDGDDELQAYGGNDTIDAGDGSDFLNTGAGDDDADGGPGFDFVDMAVSNAGPGLGDDTFTDAGVTVDLAAGTASGPPGVGSDTLSGVEAIGTTMGDDTVVGTDGANAIVAFEGNDTISLAGAGEPDQLGIQDVALPGPGDDMVTGSPGNDLVEYGFLSLSQAYSGGATIDLKAGTAVGESIGNDELSGFENAFGTGFDDVIRGTPESNLLIGIDGADTIEGDAGDDILDGDAFTVGFPEELPGTDSLDGGPGTDTCVGGGEGDANCESSQLPALAPPYGSYAAEISDLMARNGYYRYLILTSTRLIAR